ncbi:MAG TPA: nucleotidyltransferase domain-containing protein [Anaerolineales bacterium]|nr:nucleotidyltransferase domain-containing protein [Anaerolineales bacterium]
MAHAVLRTQKAVKTKIRLPRTVKTTLANFQNRALGLFPDAISRIVLYGSYARGQATPESDLDVLVVLRKDKQPVNSYIGGPGDVPWKKLIDAAIDSMVNKGPFVSVLVIGEDVFQSGFSISQAAREEGLVLWTAQQT